MLLANFAKNDYSVLNTVDLKDADEAFKLGEPVPFVLGQLLLEKNESTPHDKSLGEEFLRLSRDASENEAFSYRAGLRLLQETESPFWQEDVEEFLSHWQNDKIGLAFNARKNLLSDDKSKNKNALQYCREAGIEKLLKQYSVPGSDWRIPFTPQPTKAEELLASVYVRSLLKAGLVAQGETTPLVTAYFYRFEPDSTWYQEAVQAFEATLLISNFVEEFSEQATSRNTNTKPTLSETTRERSSTQTDKPLSTILEVAKARIAVSKRQYKKAYDSFCELLQNPMLFTEEVYSSAGKAFLYGGNGDYKKFLQLWQELPESYMTQFYQGRFLEKRGELTRSLQYFEKAVTNSFSLDRRDTALWYLLENTRKSNLKKVQQVLKTYSDNFYSVEYFEDFYEELITDYAKKADWESIVNLYLLENSRLQTSVTDKTFARLAFITARVIQEGKVNPFTDTELEKKYPQKNAYKQALVKKLLNEAIDFDYNSFYYRFKASKILDIKENPIFLPSKIRKNAKETLAILGNSKKTDSFSQEEAMLLIDTYLLVGQYKKAYSLIQTLQDEDPKLLTLDYVLKVAQKLANTSNPNGDSIRVVARALKQPDLRLTDKVIDLLFPRFYENEISDAAQKYKIGKSLLFSLIRTESYFNNKATSTVGAQGLTQLMPSTAADVAQKLKITEYDLRDPSTNVTFGAYYLSNLINRLDGNILHSLFAYNAGITRVRRWKKERPTLSDDLFLESVPFPETRNYARQILVAQTFYNWIFRK